MFFLLDIQHSWSWLPQEHPTRKKMTQITSSQPSKGPVLIVWSKTNRDYYTAKLYSRHIVIAELYWHSQKLQAWGHCLASHIWYSEVLLNSMSPSKIEVVATIFKTFFAYQRGIKKSVVAIANKRRGSINYVICL